MKRIALTIAVCLVFAGVFSMHGCSYTENNDGLSVVCSTFVQYDWCRELLGERANDTDLVLLADNGLDIHSYQPSAEDIIKIATCDVIIYIGGTSDKWIKEVLEENPKPDRKVISLLDAVGDNLKLEVLPDGAQQEHHHDGSHTVDEYDEHVWLSLRNAKVICEKITAALSAADSENKELYSENLKSYTAQLSSLDREYLSAVQSAKNDTLIFADRYPFRYLLDDYSINCYAAFSGCSSETSASFETIATLSSKLRELSLGYLITIENSDQSIARAVISAADAQDVEILSLDSMQSVSERGSSYISIMKQNLDVLKTALN